MFCSDIKKKSIAFLHLTIIAVGSPSPVFLADINPSSVAYLTQAPTGVARDVLAPVLIKAV